MLPSNPALGGKASEQNPLKLHLLNVHLYKKLKIVFEFFQFSFDNCYYDFSASSQKIILLLLLQCIICVPFLGAAQMTEH